MLLTYLLAALMILHGLVHLLYAGQSSRRLELRPGMTWPAGAWAFAALLDEGTIRQLASISLVIAALGFVAGGLALLFGAAWWPLAVGGIALFSTSIFVLFWNGTPRRLDDQGLIAIGINLALLAGTFVWRPV